MTEESPKALGKVIRIDDERIQDHLKHVVRGSVEETLIALLDAEADRLCNAGRYERSETRQDLRAGSYESKLHTRAGEVKLKVPKLRRQTFETAIIERYQRREISVEEALVEMYLAGVSVRRAEDITEALWSTQVSSGIVSKPAGLPRRDHLPRQRPPMPPRPLPLGPNHRPTLSWTLDHKSA
jgi:transposase-like protein